MLQQNNVLPVIVLSAATDGNVHGLDINGTRLSLVDHEQTLACIFVPILLVEQRLAYKDYVLYLFNSEDNLKTKISKIQQQEQNAILLIGDDTEREVYFVEDKVLVSSSPTYFSCESLMLMINKFRTNNEGKVIYKEEYNSELEKVITHIRFSGKRGNEAGVSGTRTGKNVFSRDFSPCNAVVSRLKENNEFVVYHATGVGMDRAGGAASSFLQSIDNGSGANFIAVMQNPKIPKSILKAPMITGRIAVQLQDKNVSRINVPEGYGAIACINKNTVIISQDMQFFRDDLEKEMIVKRLNFQNLGAVRVLDLGRECIPLLETVKEIKSQYDNEKNNYAIKMEYENLLNQLEVLNAKEENLPADESGNGCCFM